MDAPVRTTVTSVNDSATDVRLLAAAGDRQGATIFNDSASTLYLLLNSGVASTTNFTVRMAPGDYYELPWNRHGVYTGEIRGIWSADSTGAARITEVF